MYDVSKDNLVDNLPSFTFFYMPNNLSSQEFAIFFIKNIKAINNTSI